MWNDRSALPSSERSLKIPPKREEISFCLFESVYTQNHPTKWNNTEKSLLLQRGLRRALRRARRPCQVLAITAAQSNFTCSCGKWKPQISNGFPERMQTCSRKSDAAAASTRAQRTRRRSKGSADASAPCWSAGAGGGTRGPAAAGTKCLRCC